ncbi:hypothetical protein ONS95_011369 [Cadophora gregata]|uniref:uncharacterized protein n=1 Tax=Cadophora gregata TaxID=51156 RepID=UPI0026DAFF79|nr:uncharacterized protein ONS95_011369 [Cadophora gregata]KAK0119945.1 hypothetical protein ONS95_011369 [Cadophora gregata]KAK0120979.1 hypothetical protein ONS96_011172 [Cadophora gregata f. sp. sojae]
MYLHPSIDVAWICKFQDKDTSDMFQVLMSVRPESIPLPQVVDTIMTYITELLNPGTKRVCFDSEIWMYMLYYEAGYSVLVKSLSGFDIIIDWDQIICEGSWKVRWASRAGHADEGVKLGSSADLRRILTHHTMLEYDTHLRALVDEKGWVVRAEVVWSG